MVHTCRGRGRRGGGEEGEEGGGGRRGEGGGGEEGGREGGRRWGYSAGVRCVVAETETASIDGTFQGKWKDNNIV